MADGNDSIAATPSAHVAGLIVVVANSVQLQRRGMD